MTDEDEDITVVEVKRYAYCPRIVFITHVLHLEETITEAMEVGREEHDEAAIAPLIARLKSLKVLRSISLRSDQLRVAGKIDYTIITKNNEYIPIEIKWSSLDKERAKWDHKLQVVTYALLIDENFKTSVKRGYIYYLKDKRVIELIIDDGLKNLVRKIITNIHQMIVDERDPGVTVPFTKCVNCGYRVYCRPGLDR